MRTARWTPRRSIQPPARKRSHRPAADLPGEVVPGLGPVDAVADQAAAGGRQRHAEMVEEVPAGAGQPVVDVVPGPGRPVAVRRVRAEAAVAAGQVAVVEQAAHQLDAQAAGQVVVTGAGQPELRGAGGGPQRGDRFRRRPQLQHPLDQLRHLRSGQPVVPVPAVRADGDQAALGEPLEVGAGRRAAHPGLVGEQAGRQLAARVEGHQDPAPGAIGEQLADPGQVRVTCHDQLQSPRAYSRSRPPPRPRPPAPRRPARAGAPRRGSSRGRRR